jgi:ribosomal protein S12
LTAELQQPGAAIRKTAQFNLVNEYKKYFQVVKVAGANGGQP